MWLPLDSRLIATRRCAVDFHGPYNIYVIAVQEHTVAWRALQTTVHLLYQEVATNELFFSKVSPAILVPRLLPKPKIEMRGLPS